MLLYHLLMAAYASEELYGPHRGGLNRGGLLNILANTKSDHYRSHANLSAPNRVQVRGQRYPWGALRSENGHGLRDGTSVSGAAERHFHFFSRACWPHIFRLVRPLCEWFFEFSHKLMKGSKISVIFSGSDGLFH